MTEESTKQVTFKIKRYDPEGDHAPHFQEFVVPVSRGTTVLDGLIYVQENQDSTLAFRRSCRMAICGACAVLINKYPHLSCHTQIEEFHSDRLTVEPLANLPVIKDLITSLDLMFEKHRSIKPYIIRRDREEVENPTAEFSQLPDELNKFMQFTDCVGCGICVAACPTSASDKLFLGPQAMAQCYRYSKDSRDEGEEERLPVASAKGVWKCHLAGACSEACPKGLDPALAIQLLKRRLVSRALGFGRAQKPSSVVPKPTVTKEKIAFPAFTAKKS